MQGDIRDRGELGLAISDPKSLQRSGTLDGQYALRTMESDQQRFPPRLEPTTKPAVIISGRRPQGGGPARREVLTKRSDVQFLLPAVATSKPFRQTERDRALEKMRLARDLRIKEEQAKKLAMEEAKRQAAEDARKMAAEEAKRQAALQAESIKRTVEWPLSPDEVKQHFKRELTEFELGEIQKYKEVYYLGLGRQRKNKNKAKLSQTDDNDDGMYAAEAHDSIAYRYEIVSILGRGSFGQVFKCRDHKNHCDVAIKMLRNKKKFYRQGIVEVRLLDHLRKKDNQNGQNVIHMLDCFHFRKHICIVLELAGINLYDLLKRNAFNGFSVMAVKRFACNILQCLHLLQQEKIIHCDVKPENILLRTRQGTSGSSIYDIKVTDFGSGCFVHEQIYCYIQSRYYRAPEIILGFAYDCGIDIWSFACVLAELLMGRPLFPGENEADQLSCIMEILGLPPRRMLSSAPRARYFFDTAGNPTKTVNTRGKRRLPGTKSLQTVLKTTDRRFLDFMKRCLEWDPRTRVTADQLIHHEWMVGPPGKAAKDFPSFTNHGYRHTEGAPGGVYEQRDVVAELLSTNPFKEENDPETRRPGKRREADRDG